MLYMFKISIGSLALGLVLGAILAPVFPTQAETVLFADTFNRADSRNVDATLTGITDNTGEGFAGDDVYTHAFIDPNNAPPAYGVQDGSAGNGGGAQISGNTLQLAVGAGTSDAFINHNFTNASILASGGFSVSVDITTVNQSSTGQGGSFAVGMSLAEAQSCEDAYSGAHRYQSAFANAIGDSVPMQIVSDFWVALRADGALVWGGAPGTIITGVTGLSKTGTIKVDFFCSGFNSGSLVNYEMFYNGASKGTGSFTWSGPGENYLGLDARDNTAVGFDKAPRRGAACRRK